MLIPNIIVRGPASGVLFLALFLLFLATAANHASGAPPSIVPPRLPCAEDVYPAVPALDAPPEARFWNGADFNGAWEPQPCSGWRAGPTNIVVALAGHFSNPGDAAAILTRIGRISTFTRIRYWSVTDKKWEALFTRANALRGADAKASREDFSANEFRSGNTLHFLSADNRMGKDIVTRIAVKEAAAGHIVLETSNLSPLRFLTFTVVPAGDFETLYFLDRQLDGSWQFYSVTRVLNGSFLLSRLVTGPSYINRAVAMYRDIAGIATDRDPPAMP
jgi:hypothetical protein